MDESVEPCDDFYSFACGKFVKETVIPEDKTSLTAFSVLSDKLQEQLRLVIEEPIKSSDAKPFQLAKHLYNACMNKSKQSTFLLNQHKNYATIVKTVFLFDVSIGRNLGTCVTTQYPCFCNFKNYLQ